MEISTQEHPNKVADELFGRALFRAKLRHWWGQISGKPCELLFLGDVPDEKSPYITKIDKTVPLSLIKGTAGRPDRFDCRFRPRQERDRGRWTGLAAAMIQGNTVFPRVELVEVDEIYYVLDGHHRISVASSLGKLFIDATVIQWNTESA